MQALLNFVFVLVARLLHVTYRYRVFNTHYRDEAATHHPRGSVAIGVWHGNSFAATLAHTYQKICPLCSLSKDGQMVATLCRSMGLRPVCGSSSRGGKEARVELMENIEQGYSAAITVDGPRGPRHETKPGIVDIARKTGAPILPLIALADRYWQLKSWDRLRIPKPFSRIVVMYHRPIIVPMQAEDDAFEANRLLMNERLNELETMAEEAFATFRENGISRRRWARSYV